MKGIIIFLGLFFLAFNVGTISCSPINKVNEGSSSKDGHFSGDVQNIAPRLIFVGSINGKNFYTDNTPRNWAATKTFCTGLGMKLAQFTRAESDYIIPRLTQTGHVGKYHWTGAVLVPDLSHYTWDGDGGVIPSHTFTPYSGSTFSMTIGGGSDHVGRMYEVDRSSGNCFPLCFL